MLSGLFHKPGVQVWPVLLYLVVVELISGNVDKSNVSIEVDLEVSPVVDSVEPVESFLSCCNRENTFSKPGLNSPLESKKGVSGSLF